MRFRKRHINILRKSRPVAPLIFRHYIILLWPKKEADDIKMTRVTGKILKAENDLILQRKSDADKGDGDQKAEVTREGAPPLLEKGRAHLLEQEDGSPLAVEGRVS